MQVEVTATEWAILQSLRRLTHGQVIVTKAGNTPIHWREAIDHVEANGAAQRAENGS